MRLYSTTAMALVAVSLHAASAHAQTAAVPAKPAPRAATGTAIDPTARPAPPAAGSLPAEPGFKSAMAPTIFTKSIKEQRGRLPTTQTVVHKDRTTGPSAKTGGKKQTATQQLRAGDTTAAEVPVDIAAMAHALRNDPDLIYEFVHDNIELYPVFGVHKGALGALIDRQGSNYDQIELYVMLLRAAGYHADFVRGAIGLPLADIKNYYGVNTSNLCALEQFFAAGRIPLLFTVCNTAASGMRFEHLWARVTINGQTYDLDPSLKPHTIKTGIDLKAASGYDQATLLSDARAGATMTTNSAKNLNRANVRNRLTGYANNLIATIRATNPAGSLEDVVGGKVINAPATRLGPAPRTTTLPYAYAPYGEQVWSGDIPLQFRSVMTVDIDNQQVGLLADQFYGSRVTIAPDADNNTQLVADGEVIYNWGPLPVGAQKTMRVGIVHNAYPDSIADQSFARTIYGGETSAFVIGYGPTTRRLGKLQRERVAAAKAAGAADSSEAVLGGNLAAIGADVQAQTSMSAYLTDRLGGINSIFHHFLGTVTQRDGGPVVDLAGISTTNIQQDGNVPVGTASIISDTMHGSAFESGAMEQIFKSGVASTVRLIDDAIAGGETIYNATSANFASEVQPNLVNCSAQTTDDLAYGASNGRVLVPQDCARAIEQWKGLGYLRIINGASLYVGAFITGGYNGGYKGSRGYPDAGKDSARQKNVQNNRGDPVDMVTGNFNYSHNDLTVGGGTAFPEALSLQKVYNSGSASDDGPLGRGWSHNLAMSIQPTTDAYQGMGEDSPIDAATSIVEHLVSLDMLNDPNLPIDKLAVSVIGQRWFTDQLNNNAMSVNSNVEGSTFVRLPDGTFNSPPNNSSKLVANPDGSFTQSLVDKSRYDFGVDGNVTAWKNPNGLEVRFAYTGGKLTTVQNSLGRSLTLTYVGDRIASVQDSAGRTVGYGYDAAGNLASFTDANGKLTTFEYDQPGRMAKFYLPANPTVPQVQNVYDGLGRVDRQTDADGNMWTYLIAGTRSELVSPLGNRTADYYDGDGRVIATLQNINGVAGAKGSWDPRQALFKYDALGRLSQSSGSVQPMVVLTYDDASCNSAEKRCTNNVKTRRQVAVHNPTDVATLPDETQSFTYEPSFNKVASATNARGKVTNFTYDAVGNLASVTRPPAVDGGTLRPTTTIGYTSVAGAAGFGTFTLPTSVTRNIDATNNVTDRISYDAANGYVPRTKTVDSGGLNLTTTLGYDGVGNLTSIDGPRSDVGDVTTLAYDAERRVTTITNALGKDSKVNYNDDGDVVSTAAQLGSVWVATCYTRRPSGLVSRIVGPSNVSSSTGCPAAAAPNAVTDIAYDGDERVLTNTVNLQASEGGDRRTQYEYAPSGERSAMTDAVGTAIEQVSERSALFNYSPYTQQHIYSARNNFPNTSLRPSIMLQTNNHGRLQQVRFANTIGSYCGGLDGGYNCEQYDYDLAGNLSKWTRRDQQAFSFTYDNLDRVTQRAAPVAADTVNYTYDLLDRNLTATFGGKSGASVANAYDKAGRLISTTSGGRTVGYQYDAAGNRVRTTWPDSAFFVTYDYDALNRATAIKEKGATLLAAYSYDDVSRRTGVTYGNATTIGYGYDSQARLGSLSYDLAGTAADLTRSYTRDQAGEITGLATSNSAYDWNGYYNINRPYTTDPEERYLKSGAKSLTYDQRGNLAGDGTWTFTYDLLNQLKTAVVKNTFSLAYTYDPLGRLASRSAGRKAVTNYLYDGDQLLGEYDASGVLVRRYIRGPGIDEPIAIYDGTNALAKTFLYGDHQGSITATADAAGNVGTVFGYGPFGEPNTPTGVALRYTGQMLDADSGLYYYKARWYSPYLGRFMSADPALLVDGLQTYAYVGNEPINFVDPLGLNKEDESFCNKGNGEAAKLVGGWVSTGGDAATLLGAGLTATGLGAEAGIPIALFGKGLSAIGGGTTAFGNYCTGDKAALIGDAAGALAGRGAGRLLDKINRGPLKNPFTDKFIWSYNGGQTPQFTPNPFAGVYRDLKKEAAQIGVDKIVSSTITGIGNLFKK